jgi:trans-aconitate 2-methyltransferase
LTSDRTASNAAPIAWDAADYARNSRMQEEYARKQLAQLNLAGSEAVLDIGCGDGRITAAIAQLVPRGRVLGIDSSAEMIALAQKTHPLRHSNLSFAVLDARALAFDSEFDLVFSTSALHWVKDHVAVLRGIQQALKPGGRIYLTFGARGTLSGLAPIVDAVMKEPRWRARFENFQVPFGFYGPEEYREWLDQLGLVTERLDLIERDVMHPGREAFEGWLRTTAMPFTHRVEPQRRQQFLSEIVDRYLAANPADAQGLIHVRMVNLLVKATKPAET